MKIDCPKCDGTGNACEKCLSPVLKEENCNNCELEKHWLEGGEYEIYCPECHGTGNVDV